MISPKEAANKFLERIIINIFNGVSHDWEMKIEEGLPGKVDDPLAIEKWYRSLGNNEKNLLTEIITAIIKETIFRFLVVLDNMTGGPPVIGQISDFALYVQSYSDSQSKSKNQPKETVRFNTLEDDELHELFLDALDD